MPWSRSVAVWLGLVPIMVAHGIARELWMRPVLGELGAHQLSSILACGILIFAAFAVLPWLGVVDAPRQQLYVGAVWLCLTVVFEFGFGHYVAHQSWGRLLGDYNLLSGRLWSLVLVTTLLAPRIAGWLRQRWR